MVIALRGSGSWEMLRNTSEGGSPSGSVYTTLNRQVVDSNVLTPGTGRRLSSGTMRKGAVLSITRMSRTFSEERRSSSVTLSFTRKSPGNVYVWFASADVPFVPSPKSHRKVRLWLSGSVVHDELKLTASLVRWVNPGAGESMQAMGGRPGMSPRVRIEPPTVWRCRVPP